MARNLTNLFANYTNLNTGNTVGNYSGKLSHNGELLALSMPQTLYGTNTDLVAEDRSDLRHGRTLGRMVLRRRQQSGTD